MSRAPLLALTAALLLAGCSGSSGPAPVAASSPSAEPSFGGYPTFLPPDTLGGAAVHTTVDASAQSPALVVPGDPVRVHLAQGTVVVDLLGPEVPNTGLPATADTTPATWVLTFHDATAEVPLQAAGFAALDGTGVLHRVSAVGAAPAAVRPGQTVRLTLTATVETGQGRLRWIPTGHLAPVEWDYTVETD